MLGGSHHCNLPNLTFYVAPRLWPRVRSDMNNIEIWGVGVDPPYGNLFLRLRYYLGSLLSNYLITWYHIDFWDLGFGVQEFILPMGIFSYASANLPPSGKKTSISAYLWLCETDTMVSP